MLRSSEMLCCATPPLPPPPTSSSPRTSSSSASFRFALGRLAGAMPTPSTGRAGARELRADQHGRGHLNIAVEGNKVSMELEVPGADIVGFEHAAKTDREKAAVETAKTQLAAPLTL